MFGLSERLSKRLIQKVKSPSVVNLSKVSAVHTETVSHRHYPHLVASATHRWSIPAADENTLSDEVLPAGIPSTPRATVASLILYFKFSINE